MLIETSQAVSYMVSGKMANMDDRTLVPEEDV